MWTPCLSGLRMNGLRLYTISRPVSVIMKLDATSRLTLSYTHTNLIFLFLACCNTMNMNRYAWLDYYIQQYRGQLHHLLLVGEPKWPDTHEVLRRVETAGLLVIRFKNMSAKIFRIQWDKICLVQKHRTCCVRDQLDGDPAFFRFTPYCGAGSNTHHSNSFAAFCSKISAIVLTEYAKHPTASTMQCS